MSAPKEQFPRNSQVPVLIHVSNLESGTAVSTDGESRLKSAMDLDCGKSLRFRDRGGQSMKIDLAAVFRN